MNEIIIDSKKSGPVITIIGGIHGNEPCGVNAINELKNLEINSGKINFIFGNPKAIEQNVRFVGMNLNRAFRDDSEMTEEEKGAYEYKRSREIMPFLDESDILLDIHSSATKNSTPFIICEPHSSELAECLPFGICCYGFDDIHPGGTDYYMNKKNKPAICIECGNNDDPNATDLAVKSIKFLLIKLGMINGELNCKKEQKIFNVKEIYKTKTDNFKLEKSFKDFEEIKAGQLIGIDGDKKIYSDAAQHILFARNCYKIGGEGFIYLK